MKITMGQYVRLTLVMAIPLLIAGSVWRDEINVFKRQGLENISCDWGGGACRWDVGDWEILRQSDLHSQQLKIFFYGFSERIEINIAEEDKERLAETPIAHIANAKVVPFTKIGPSGLEIHDTSCDVKGVTTDGALLICSRWPFDASKGEVLPVSFIDANNKLQLKKMLNDASLMQEDRASSNKWADYGNMMVPLAAYLLLTLAALLLKGVIHFVIHGVSIGSPHYTAEELAALEEEKERYRQKRAKK